MKIQFENSPAAAIVADALAFAAFEVSAPAQAELTVEQPAQSSHDLPTVEQGGWLTEMRQSGEFTGKPYELALLHRPSGIAARRLAVIGVGHQPRFGPLEARRAAGALVRQLKPKGVRSVAFVLPDTASPQVAQAAAEGAILGAWEPDKYKSDLRKNEKAVEEFIVVVNNPSSELYTAALRTAEIVAEAQNVARDLVHEPANVLTPTRLHDAARDLAAECNLEFEALDRARMEELGMGALLAVAQGSDEPPYLLVLRYRPARTFGGDHLALVGKGVTFDTGGYSLKPADSMERMKYDMAGAAAVLGAMRAIATCKPQFAITAFIATVENMVSGRAQRPGDIVKTMAGKTVEVLNTDAEGRLILADALTYARQQGVTHMIDVATLTGAIGVALGHHNMGVFSNQDDFVRKFLASSATAGEKAWQLPMDEEYKDYLKSAFADLPNVGGRYGGAITGAWFLREFADPTPWIHLDIASTAWLDDGRAWLAKGPSGVGVRSLVQVALDWHTNS